MNDSLFSLMKELNIENLVSYNWYNIKRYKLTGIKIIHETDRYGIKHDLTEYWFQGNKIDNLERFLKLFELKTFL